MTQASERGLGIQIHGFQAGFKTWSPRISRGEPSRRPSRQTSHCSEPPSLRLCLTQRERTDRRDPTSLLDGKTGEPRAWRGVLCNAYLLIPTAAPRSRSNRLPGGQRRVGGPHRSPTVLISEHSSLPFRTKIQGSSK